MNNNPLVTIIITCYNKEKYIERTIKSAINQSYNNLEIIIINDGSTDDSPNMIKDYQQIDKRISVVNQENSGSPGLARNAGIKIARGEFINFLDGDDLLYPKFVEETLNFQKENPKVDIVHTSWELVDNNYKNIALKNAPNSEDYLRDLLLGNLFATHALLIRRSLINKVGLMLDIQTEDWEYWARCAKKGAKFERLNKILVATVSVPDSDHVINSAQEKRFFQAIDYIYDGDLEQKYRKLRIVTLIKCNLYILEHYIQNNLVDDVKKKLIFSTEFIRNNHIVIDELKYLKSNLCRLPLFYGLKLSKNIALSIYPANKFTKYYYILNLFLNLLIHKIKIKIKG